LYDRLFTDENPTGHEDRDFLEFLNPDSMRVLSGALVHRDVASAPCGTRYQFERMGYFCVDKDSTPERPIINRIIGLRDSWAKQNK
jgi:glutaminyl-tRNA synthetase